MTNDSLLPFSLPSVERKKITAAFDGGRLSSDGGVMLLGLAERRTGIADRLAAEIVDRRDPTRVVHTLSDILRARIGLVTLEGCVASAPDQLVASDDENAQLPRLSVSTGDHPARRLVVSALHAQFQGCRGPSR
jgi:hypothetical protein